MGSYRIKKLGQRERRSHKPIILAIDLGNTTISLAVLRGKTVMQTYCVDLTASLVLLKSKINSVVKRVKRRYPKIQKVILCSVVPKASKLVQSVIKSQMKINALVIGKDIIVPIKNKYKNPKHVGQDRLVCAYAAKIMYGQPTIIIDFGTAITFDVVTHKGEYEGGLIVPGIRLSAESLFHKTALLPKIRKIKTPQSLIGKNTQESILSGIFHGYGAMCNGLIDLISGKIQGRPKVIVTGGHTSLMRKFIKRKVHKVDRNLVFKGMILLEVL